MLTTRYHIYINSDWIYLCRYRIAAIYLRWNYDMHVLLYHMRCTKNYNKIMNLKPTWVYNMKLRESCRIIIFLRYKYRYISHNIIHINILYIIRSYTVYIYVSWYEQKCLYIADTHRIGIYTHHACIILLQALDAVSVYNSGA